MSIIYREIGSRLGAMRVEAAVQQAELADELGVSRTTLCRWEQGKRSFRLDQFVRWSRALCVDPAELLR